MYKETVVREIFLTSTLNITATETGILSCNATNYFGHDDHNSTFLVTGKEGLLLVIIIINFRTGKRTREAILALR